MSNILKFSDYNVLDIVEDELSIFVHAEIKEPASHCFKCHHTEIVGFGRREETIKDLPLKSKRAIIILKRRRYLCKSCGKTFLEPVPHKDNKRQMTARLIEFIEHESVGLPFTTVATLVGIDEKTVRNIIND